MNMYILEIIIRLYMATFTINGCGGDIMSYYLIPTDTSHLFASLLF